LKNASFLQKFAHKKQKQKKTLSIVNTVAKLKQKSQAKHQSVS